MTKLQKFKRNAADVAIVAGIISFGLFILAGVIVSVMTPFLAFLSMLKWIFT